MSRIRCTKTVSHSIHNEIIQKCCVLVNAMCNSGLTCVLFYPSQYELAKSWKVEKNGDICTDWFLCWLGEGRRGFGVLCHATIILVICIYHTISNTKHEIELSFVNRIVVQNTCCLFGWRWWCFFFKCGEYSLWWDDRCHFIFIYFYRVEK